MPLGLSTASEATRASVVVSYTSTRSSSQMQSVRARTASIEGEGRWQFNDRWSAVGFLGTGVAQTRGERFDATEKVASGGVGFRYRLARKFGMDVGMDIARRPGTTAVYLIVGNSWFRP